MRTKILILLIVLLSVFTTCSKEPLDGPAVIDTLYYDEITTFIGDTIKTTDSSFVLTWQTIDNLDTLLIGNQLLIFSPKITLKTTDTTFMFFVYNNDNDSLFFVNLDSIGSFRYEPTYTETPTYENIVWIKPNSKYRGLQEIRSYQFICFGLNHDTLDVSNTRLFVLMQYAFNEFAILNNNKKILITYDNQEFRTK